MEMPKSVPWVLIPLLIIQLGNVCFGTAARRSSYTTAAVCQSLPFVEHGSLKRINPTKVEVKCDPSFRFYSGKNPATTSSFIHCKRRGWTEPRPQCVLKPNHCLAPHSVENGKVSQLSNYPEGIVIQYTCNKGYRIRGKSERTCRPYDLEWTDFDPVCEEYDPTLIGSVASSLDKQFVEKMQLCASTGCIVREIGYDVEFQGLDLILLFDKSSSIHGEEFNEGIEFAKFLVERFNVSNGSKTKEGGTRIAVYTFGNDPVEEISWDNLAISSTEKAKQKLNTIKCAAMCDGGTNMVDALARITRVFEKDARPKAKKALFVTSDGVPTGGSSKNPIDYYTTKLKNKVLDVEIFTIGIGKDVDVDFLRSLANEPPEDHVFILKEFKEFSDVVKIIREKQPLPPPPPVTECGYLSENGRKVHVNSTGEVKAGAWPWLAAIIKVNPSSGKVTFGCNGVLICRRWVITPARCLFNDGQVLAPQNIYIILGEDDLSVESKHEQHFYATDIIIHPDFDVNRTNDRDIALIKLNSDADLDDYVRTACIPNEREDYLSAETGSEGTTIGWLITSENRKLISYNDVTSLHASQTKLSLYGLDTCETVKPTRTSCNDLFTAGNSGLPSNCTGEIGSAFHRTDHRGRQLTLGLSVYSKGCSLNNKLMIFVPLGNHQDWVRANTNLCTEQHRTQYNE